MATVYDTTTIALTNGSTGVVIDIDFSIHIGFDGGPYSQLYLTNINMDIQRSTNGTTFSSIHNENINPGVSTVSYNNSTQYIDTTAVSGTTYWYKVYNGTTHVEVVGTPP